MAEVRPGKGELSAAGNKRVPRTFEHRDSRRRPPPTTADDARRPPIAVQPTTLTVWPPDIPTSSDVDMPRNLARLRYRLPPAPVSFEGLEPARAHLLEKRVAQYVVRQSNPRHLKLQTVVNAKAKPLSTGKTTVRPIKPYTLRDVVDPAGTARHGQIIYVFRSIKTNQIIYSLQELLDV